MIGMSLSIPSIPLVSGLVLSQNLLQNIPVHIGYAIVVTLKAISELGVVDAQLVKRSSVEVVYMHRIFDNVVAEVICLAMNVSWFDTSAAGHPNTVGWSVGQITIRDKRIYKNRPFQSTIDSATSFDVACFSLLPA